MVCKDKWAEEARKLQEITQVAPESVDGAKRCDRPGCGKLLRKDTGRCLVGHVQGDAGKSYALELGDALVCLADAEGSPPAGRVMGLASDKRVREAREILRGPRRELNGAFAVDLLVQAISELGEGRLDDDPRLQVARQLFGAPAQPHGRMVPGLSSAAEQTLALLRENSVVRRDGTVRPPQGQTSAYRLWKAVIEGAEETLRVPEDFFVTYLLEVQPRGTADVIFVAGRWDDEADLGTVLVREELPLIHQRTDSFPVEELLQVADDVHGRVQGALDKYVAAQSAAPTPEPVAETASGQSTVLDQPLSTAELRSRMDEHGRVQGVVRIPVAELANLGPEGYLDLASALLTGTELLMDIHAKAVGHEPGAYGLGHLLVEVSGEVEQILELAGEDEDEGGEEPVSP